MKVFKYSSKYLLKHIPKLNILRRDVKRFASKDGDLDKIIEEQNKLLNFNNPPQSNVEQYNSEDEDNSNLKFSSISSEYMDPKLEINIDELRLKCNGCGTHLQTKNSDAVGYVPAGKIKDYFDNKYSDTPHNDDKMDIKENNDEIEVIYEDENIIPKEKNHKSLFSEYEEIKKEMKKETIYCERCFKLSNYTNLEGKNVSKEKAQKYIHLVKKIDSNKLIDLIFSKIPKETNVFYIFDIFDMESTIKKEILVNLEKKGSKVVFIGNKFDVLPKNSSDDRIRIWVGERLKELCKGILTNYTYMIVSSKTGHNFDYVIYRIKKIKENMKDIKYPRIYILGYTNVGKSTFINKLIDHSNKFKLRELKKHHKDYENADIKFSSADLTSSPLPGTTIGISKVSDINLGVKIFDTPGIPNKDSMSYYMDEIIDIISVNLNKKIISHSLNIKQGYSIWIGAVARIDFLNGDDKYFSFFFSNNVTIHKTEIIHAEETLERQYGRLLRPVLKQEFKDVKMKKHEFNLKCNDFSILNYDISISGLGWFSVSGKGFCQLIVSVPENVKVTLRKKALMPYEVKFKGLKKYFGNTINKDSKINRKFNINSNSKKSKAEDNTNKRVNNFSKEEINKNI